MAEPNALTERQREYREVYLQSDHWRETRAAALERADHRCQVCNKPGGLDVHHRTYERIGREEPGDLTVLCRGCHDLFHSTSRVARTRRGKQKAAKRARQPLVDPILGVLALAVEPMRPGLIAFKLAEDPTEVAQCLLEMRRDGLVVPTSGKQRRRWFISATGRRRTWGGPHPSAENPPPGIIGAESIRTIEQAIPDPINAWCLVRSALMETPWLTASQIRDLVNVVPVTGTYDDWAYRVLAVAHDDGLVTRRDVQTGVRKRVEWALTPETRDAHATLLAQAVA